MPSEPNLTLPLLLAGAALALLGVMRLARLGLRSMPGWVAAAAVGAGIAVGGLGVLLPGPADEAPQLPLRAGDGPTEAPTGGADTSGSIRGRVLTTTDEPVADATVILRRFERTEQVEATRTATGPEGGFAFPDLEAAPEVAYAVEVEYRGGVFPTDLLFLGPHGAAEDVELTVAPPTDVADDLTVAVDSTVLVGDAEGLQVIQVTAIHNRGDEAYVGPVRLPALPGAAGLTPQGGLVRTRLSVEDDEIVSLAPLLPGVTELVYEYGLPAPGGERTVERRVHLPTRRLDVLVSGDLVVRDPAGMRDAGEVELGADGEERPYHRFTASDLDPGDAVSPVVGLGGGDGALRTALIVGGALLALAILAIPLVRRWRRGSDEGAGPVDREPAPVAEEP